MEKREIDITDKVEFIIKNWDDMSYFELADAINLTPMKVKNLGHYCRMLGVKLQPKREEVDWKHIEKSYSTKPYQWKRNRGISRN